LTNDQRPTTNDYKGGVLIKRITVACLALLLLVAFVQAQSKLTEEQIQAKVRELMQGVHRLDVPLVADVGVGDNWDQAH
jgi:hypothetical protein